MTPLLESRTSKRALAGALLAAALDIGLTLVQIFWVKVPHWVLFPALAILTIIVAASVVLFFAAARASDSAETTSERSDTSTTFDLGDKVDLEANHVHSTAHTMLRQAGGTAKFAGRIWHRPARRR